MGKWTQWAVVVLMASLGAVASAEEGSDQFSVDSVKHTIAPQGELIYDLNHGETFYGASLGVYPVHQAGIRDVRIGYGYQWKVYGAVGLDLPMLASYLPAAIAEDAAVIGKYLAIGGAFGWDAEQDRVFIGPTAGLRVEF